MTWFKVDDKLHDHRKARAAGATAMGVWLLAGSWSADNLTDGFVPAAILTRWGRPRDAARLVEVGLWHVAEEDGEKGWRFHEWDERQPTRAQKLAERAARAEAGRIGGKASGRSRREAKPKQGASQVVEPPTRPDPSITSGGDDKSSSDDSGTAQTYIAEWIEHCAERPPSRVIGQVSKEVKQLVADGVAPLRIRRGLAEWHKKNLHPSTLPSVVHETGQAEARSLRVVDDNDWMRRRPQPKPPTGGEPA